MWSGDYAHGLKTKNYGLDFGYGFALLVLVSRVYGIGVPGHFDRTFSPVLRRQGTRHGHQTHSTCSPHDRLHAHGGLSHLTFPVWPLGALNVFLLPSISRPSLTFSRSSLHRLIHLLGRYKSPRSFRTYYFRFGGQPPKTEILLVPKAIKITEFNFL